MGPGHTLPSISEDNEAEEEAEEVEEPPLSPQSPHLRRNGKQPHLLVRMYPSTPDAGYIVRCKMLPYLYHVTFVFSFRYYQIPKAYCITRNN